MDAVSYCCFYQKCKFMIFNNFSDNDITNVVDMTFSVNHDSFGQIQVRELKPGGKEISVNETNKKEYVQLYVNFRFTHGIEQQFRALQKGFCELVPQHLLASFDEKELELVIGGLGQIDLEDWKANVRLKHCTPLSNIVQWFWRAVDSYSEERRARLLQFVTGSSRVPLQGKFYCTVFKKLNINKTYLFVFKQALKHYKVRLVEQARVCLQFTRSRQTLTTCRKHTLASIELICRPTRLTRNCLRS